MAPIPRLVDRVLVIGHRGASAWRPEHTLASYRKAIEDGADVIEPDLVCTRDGVLVARHENEISGTTNVADVPAFASRRTTKNVDGVTLTGWFTEDFTLDELKTLRARERIPDIRPDNTAFNDQFDIPTLREIIALARDMSASTGRTIGLYPETKHPGYFHAIGLPMEETLLDELSVDAWSSRMAPVFIQSFETENLRLLRQRIGKNHPTIRLVQLLGKTDAQPWDFVGTQDLRCYGDLMHEAGLQEIAAYADAIGPDKDAIARDPALVRNAHAAGLLVHPYTFRPENTFLPSPLQTADGANARNVAGAVCEIRTYLDAGIDGFFTDDPALGRLAVDGN